MEKQNFTLWILCLLAFGHSMGFCDMCKQQKAIEKQKAIEAEKYWINYYNKNLT